MRIVTAGTGLRAGHVLTMRRLAMPGARLAGGFMPEKCYHDPDIYNMVTGPRPARAASFGGRRSYLPEHAPASNAEAEIFRIKKSVRESGDDPFRSDGDSIDFQNAILACGSGASLAFHTNLNVSDEYRRFCIPGSHGMAEGDFMRSFLRITELDAIGPGR